MCGNLTKESVLRLINPDGKTIYYFTWILYCVNALHRASVRNLGHIVQIHKDRTNKNIFDDSENESTTLSKLVEPHSSEIERCSAV